MKNPYPYEKFSNAVAGMAVSPKSIQERVADAFIYNLIHLEAAELPEAIRHQFIALRENLTAIKPTGDEGRIFATTDKMSTQEAVDVAQEIVTMADIVEADYKDH